VLTLLWGLPRDAPMAAVARELAALEVPTLFLDQRDVLRTTVKLPATGGDIRGAVLRVGDRELDLCEAGAVYLRPHETARLPVLSGRSADDEARTHAAAVDHAMYSWLGVSSAFLVNPVVASAGNGSKPWQLARIRQAGFCVPDTLVTTDPDLARDFIDRNRDVVFKSVSGVRSRVRRVVPDDLERLDAVASCPTQFQRRVEGVDVRVHVVGRRVFATRITCEADDYRYAEQSGHPRARLSATELPSDVERRCVALASALGLPVAGVDLRVDADGAWYCFEVNPSPAFTYYECHTGQRIARSVAALLAAAAVVHAA
jgi:RimK-like ATP-grasp domain